MTWTNCSSEKWIFLFILDCIWAWSLVLAASSLAGGACWLYLLHHHLWLLYLSAGVRSSAGWMAGGLHRGLNALGLLPSAKQSIRGRSGCAVVFSQSAEVL